MKLIILEDVQGMSRHAHSFFKEKAMDFVVINSAEEASMEYIKGETVFLHYTNHSCMKWDHCNQVLFEVEDSLPHIHIHSGESCSVHTPSQKKGVKNLPYLGSMEELYENILLCIEEMQESYAKSYLEECLIFENQFTTSMPMGAGSKLCRWIREKWGAEKTYILDAEDWERYEDIKNITYMEKRERLLEKVFFQSDTELVLDVGDELLKVMEDFHSENFDAESSKWLVYDMRSNSEVLAYLIIEKTESMNFLKEDLFFYALNRFPKLLLEKKHYQRILDESYKDDVTSLYNQKYLNKITNDMIEEAKKNDQSFSVLFVDVDFFKKVNDTKGHLVGSAILCEMGEILKRNIRERDVAFRYGGDEFLLLLHNTDSDAAQKIAERIRAEVEEFEFLKEEHSIRVTVSIGIASYPEHATTNADVIELADQAMYYGKNKSRNIVFVAS